MELGQQVQGRFAEVCERDVCLRFAHEVPRVDIPVQALNLYFNGTLGTCSSSSSLR